VLAIERGELKEIAEFGKIEVLVKQWMKEDERGSSCEIPQKLVIPEFEAETIFRVDFDAQAWDGMGHIKVLFAVFHDFRLLDEFQVSNEKLFRFLEEISQTYNKVPYHNWRHAVDVTQFVTYELKTTGFCDALPRLELLGLIVAAICHDANHDGFTNVFNVRAETPLGILFKNQSVMETHHCSMAIQILAKEENNIISIFEGQDLKRLWSYVIRLILITDMAAHFQFLGTLKDIMQSGGLKVEDSEHRMIAMQGILKCGDISNVSRPFDLADKWCTVLCEEFFRQGDLEMANGMEYTSPLNDREHLDKPKSQIGFYTFVCLPLYEAVAAILPSLSVNCAQVCSNLEIWKAAEIKPPCPPPSAAE
jgi:hypothetical protein